MRSIFRGNKNILTLDCGDGIPFMQYYQKYHWTVCLKLVIFMESKLYLNKGSKKIDKSLVRLITKKSEERTIQEWKRVITEESTDIKSIIRGYYN